MSEKRRTSNRLRTGMVFGSILGIMVLLLLIEAWLALPAPLDKLMQFGILILIYGLLAIWINTDPGALIR
ncbi:MAG: hypothetical protein JW934_16775 [Anaerolineae bacterium]|nr:hypothetical protein [Anaerolineae bacterium]